MKTIKFPHKKSIASTRPLSSAEKLETAKNINKLDDLVSKSNEVLIRAKSVFPFDLFPDEIIVTKDKVDIMYGIFFFSKEIFPLKLDNIESVILDYDIFFGSIELKVTGFRDYPDRIRFLKKKDALRLKRIIMGLIICHREKVDITQIPLDETRNKLEEIGKAQEHE